MNRRRKSCYRPYEGKRWPLWRKAVLALLLAGALAFGALFGAVMYGAYDHIQGEPRLMVILGCQVKPWGPSILLQDRTRRWITWRSTRTSRWWSPAARAPTNPLLRRRLCTTT